MMPYDPFINKEFESADELWDALSPTKQLFKPPCKPLYRGQANADWGLIPSVLRRSSSDTPKTIFNGSIKADEQVASEICLLDQFVRFCDQLGVRIPNDSINFRTDTLNINAQNQNRFLLNPKCWPNEELIEVMALAQHHGVPTRLLDWTTQPYVAAYFAASSALSNAEVWKDDQKIAFWVLDIERINLYPNVKVIRVPGSMTPRLTAQASLFTLQRHTCHRGETFEISGLEHEFTALPDTPLIKITLPAKESIRLHELCGRVGVTGATVYQSIDGAGKAVINEYNAYRMKKHLNP